MLCIYICISIRVSRFSYICSGFQSLIWNLNDLGLKQSCAKAQNFQSDLDLEMASLVSPNIN